jgi:hypothetical protein
MIKSLDPYAQSHFIEYCYMTCLCILLVCLRDWRTKIILFFKCPPRIKDSYDSQSGMLTLTIKPSALALPRLGKTYDDNAHVDLRNIQGKNYLFHSYHQGPDTATRMETEFFGLKTR